MQINGVKIVDNACCVCGHQLIAKYKRVGHFLEIVGMCPACGGTE